jgi:hypothetical protein
MTPHRRNHGGRDDGPGRQDRIFVADLPPLAPWVGRSECDALRTACGHILNTVAWRRICSAPYRANDGLRRNAAASDGRRFRSGHLATVKGCALYAQSLVARIVLLRRSGRLSSLHRGEPRSEAGFDSFCIGGGRGVLGREVLVDPVCGLVRGFEIAEFGDQSVAQRPPLVRGQHDSRGLITLAFLLTPNGAKGSSSTTGFGVIGPQ